MAWHSPMLQIVVLIVPLTLAQLELPLHPLSPPERPPNTLLNRAKRQAYQV